MSIKVQIPPPLHGYCEGASELHMSAGSVRGALDELERRYPSLYRNICDETGRVRPHVNLFVNKSHVREREGIETTLEPGDVLFILPAVSGG